MCGIACIAGQSHEFAKDRMSSMLECMAHRGPNDRGVWTMDGITLGHLRLSIIDTSSAGHQPMQSHDRRFTIIFNGEIFNYIELRSELKTLGSTFKTEGDTEVIMEAYRQWGEDCVTHFNGMWAFVLHDKETQSLFVSRDRFGIKPLYYNLEEGVLSIASEMKGLIKGTEPTPDWNYFYAFFDRKTSLGDDRTVYAGIKHLRPGHSMTWHNKEIKIRRYWQSNPDQFREKYDYSDPVKTFRTLMTDSVKLRLRSDVPLGVCLSGGIDSSVIATLIKSFGVTPHTFSTVYSDPQYSEERFMDAVNTQIGAISKKITPKSSDFFSVMEQIVSHHDEPVRMPGVFSHWHVMDCAHHDVTVVLDGQGGDEVCGGYNDYYPSYIASLVRDGLTLHQPSEALTQVGSALNAIKDQMGSSKQYLMEGLLRTLPSIARDQVRHESSKHKLFTESFVGKVGAAQPDRPDDLRLLNNQKSVLDREMYRTFVETNMPMLLRYEDRNSMAFSMEARVPFLDYRVVEFCQGLDYRYKMRDGITKWIVREAFKDLLPEPVLNRKDKKGFPTPVGPWFKNELAIELKNRLEHAAFLDAGIINKTEMDRILGEHLSGKANHERALFRLITLDIWLRDKFLHGVAA